MRAGRRSRRAPALCPRRAEQLARELASVPRSVRLRRPRSVQPFWRAGADPGRSSCRLGEPDREHPRPERFAFFRRLSEVTTGREWESRLSSASRSPVAYATRSSSGNNSWAAVATSQTEPSISSRRFPRGYAHTRFSARPKPPISGQKRRHREPRSAQTPAGYRRLQSQNGAVRLLLPPSPAGLRRLGTGTA